MEATKRVRILGAHCDSCGTEAYGYYVNVDEAGQPIFGQGYVVDRPRIVLPYPVEVPIEDVQPVGDVYECELCGGRVLVAMEPV